MADLRMAIQIHESRTTRDKVPEASSWRSAATGLGSIQWPSQSSIREHELLPGWGPYVRRIADLSRLRDRWDGVSPAPERALLSRLWAVSSRADLAWPTIDISVYPDGSVVAEWSEPDGFASLHLLAGNSMLFVEERGDMLSETVMEYDEATARALMSGGASARS